jgi:hypothetical protein
MRGHNKMGRLDVFVMTLIILVGLGKCRANHMMGNSKKKVAGGGDMK